MAKMNNSSTAEQLEATPDAETAFKEYQILEKAADRGTSLNYTVAGIFLGGLFTATAILIPKVAQQNCGWQLIGYFLASVVILLCTWFWFMGIHLMWRARAFIMFRRLQELEEQLGFKAHRRIRDFYKSLENGHEWPDDKEPEWYTKLRETPGPVIPWRPNTTTWWYRIIWAITAVYIITWLFAIYRCRPYLCQWLLGSIL